MTETSSVSEVSYSESYPVEQAPPAEGEGESKRFYVIGCILILLLLCAIIYVLLSRSYSSEASGEIDDGGASSDDKGIYVDDSTTPRTPTTKPSPRVTTAQVITTSPTPDTFNETTHPPKPPPRKPRVTSTNDVIMCTVSFRALSALQLPPDGVCTHIVYEEVVIRDQKIISLYDTNGGSLNAFMDHSKQARKTRHGLSFSYEYADDASIFISGMSKTFFSDIWNSNIHDFGVLYVYDRTGALQCRNNLKLSLLNTLQTLQRNLKKESDTYDTFAGVLNTEYGDGASNPMESLAIISKRYRITIIILLTHHFLLEGVPSPRPPTRLTGSGRPPKLQGISANLTSGGVKTNVTLLISFSLAIYKYRMTSDWKGDAATGTYESFAPIQYYDACDMKDKMVEQSGKEYAYIANKDQQLLLMYDTMDTFIYKLQHVFKTYNRPKHGVAIFDVEYDQYNTTCGTPPFHRLLQITRFMNL